MNKSIIKDEVQWLMEAINEQVGDLSSSEDRIPQIELDMLMDNVRKLYENLHLLSRMNDSFDHLRDKERERMIHEEEEEEEEEDEDEVEEEVEGGVEGETDREITVEIEGVTKFVEEPMVSIPERDPIVIKYTVAQEPEAKVTPEPPVYTAPQATVNFPPAEDGLFSDNEFDFGVRLREAREKALSPGKGRPAGVRNAISINDKFLFINELFDGNLKDYNENIETLNGFHDLKSAFDFLDLLRQRNRWETDGKGFRRLKEIIEGQF